MREHERALRIPIPQWVETVVHCFLMRSRSSKVRTPPCLPAYSGMSVIHMQPCAPSQSVHLHTSGDADPGSLTDPCHQCLTHTLVGTGPSSARSPQAQYEQLLPALTDPEGCKANAQRSLPIIHRKRCQEHSYQCFSSFT